MPYIEGEAELEDVIEELKKQTRRYAKRQLTWFMRDEQIRWFDIDMYENSDSLFKDACDYIDEVWRR